MPDSVRAERRTWRTCERIERARDGRGEAWVVGYRRAEGEERPPRGTTRGGWCEVEEEEEDEGREDRMEEGRGKTREEESRVVIRRKRRREVLPTRGAVSQV